MVRELKFVNSSSETEYIHLIFSRSMLVESPALRRQDSRILPEREIVNRIVKRCWKGTALPPAEHILDQRKCPAGS
jgi:hypothetical protein